VSAAAGGLGPHDAALVRRIPLFQRLSDRALGSLLAEAVVRTVPRGATLFLQDEPANRFYVLLDGWVKLYRLTAEGAEAIVNIVAPGETFAEAAMFASARFPVCAEVVADARVLSLTAPAFARSLAADPDIAFAMLGALSLRLRHLVQQIEQLQVKSAPQRVADFLLRLCPPASEEARVPDGAAPATVTLPFNKALIARRLGMQPETFSRALGRLRPLGVERHGATVVIRDPAALRAFCAAERSSGPEGSGGAAGPCG
jgi:CRP-like cAMP-binding protein